jgi:chemotaxis protein CheC
VTSHHNLQEIDYSALEEIGNILTSAYLGAVSQLLNITLIPSVPGLFLDVADSVREQIFRDLVEVKTEALLVETEFTESISSIKGSFFLLLDEESVHKVIDAATESARE